MLGLALGRTLLAPEAAGDPFAVADGRMIARGELAEALETQLASVQPRNAATRIGVTFTRNDGRACRTLEG